jgi:hypothetical protein
MRQRLSETDANTRERCELAARELGAMAALNMAIRLGIWPEADDLARWCGALSAGCVVDSLTAAHERMVLAKWTALAARGWHLADAAAEAAESAAEAAERRAREEAWVAARATQLAHAEAAEAARRREAQARAELARMTKGAP